MKKYVALLAAIAIVFSSSACGKKKDKTEETTAPSDTVSASTESQSNGPLTFQAGKVVFLDPSGSGILKGVKISGNRAGDEINKKDPALDGVRCIFELNEWVDFYPDTDKTAGIEVWVFAHKGNANVYKDAEFSMNMDGYIINLSLMKDEDPDLPWGSICLNPDSVEPGVYDFVFVYNGSAFAGMAVRFYAEKELEPKSDAELENLMKGF